MSQDPMSEDPVLYRDSVPGLRSSCPPISRWAPKGFPFHISGTCILMSSHEFHISSRKAFHGSQKDLKSPSRQTAEHKIPDPLSPSAAGAFFYCNFLISVFLLPSVHETSICDSPIRYAAFSTVLFSTFIFPKFMPWKVRISRSLYTY